MWKSEVKRVSPLIFEAGFLPELIQTVWPLSSRNPGASCIQAYSARVTGAYCQEWLGGQCWRSELTQVHTCTISPLVTKSSLHPGLNMFIRQKSTKIPPKSWKRLQTHVQLCPMDHVQSREAEDSYVQLETKSCTCLTTLSKIVLCPLFCCLLVTSLHSSRAWICFVFVFQCFV